MKRVYTQPEAELIVLDVNDLQVMMLSLSDEKGGLAQDSFGNMFGWDSKINGTENDAFSIK